MLQRFRRILTRPFTVLPSLEAYEHWAVNYPPQAHNLLMQIEEHAMLSLLPDVSGSKVLDLACGTGRYGLLAEARGASQVIGLDNSSAMLARNPLLRIAQATTEALPLASGSVDGIICGMALGHLPVLRPSLSEISRVLRPGGWALISDFHPFIFLTGGQRTFSTPDGKTYAVEHHAHLYANYHDETEGAGLKINRVLEPTRPGDGMPVVIVFQCYKSPLPGRSSI